MTNYETKDERAALEADFERLPVDRSHAPGEVSTVVSVRLRGDELSVVEQAATAAGLPLSTFIRQAALGAAGSLDVRAVSAQVEAIQNEARKLAALLRGDAA
ncbi:MAG: plasmid mobilization protein [Nocardioidaceae bacterium]